MKRKNITGIVLIKHFLLTSQFVVSTWTNLCCYFEWHILLMLATKKDDCPEVDKRVILKISYSSLNIIILPICIKLQMLDNEQSWSHWKQLIFLFIEYQVNVASNAYSYYKQFIYNENRYTYINTCFAFKRHWHKLNCLLHYWEQSITCWFKAYLLIFILAQIFLYFLQLLSFTFWNERTYA